MESKKKPLLRIDQALNIAQAVAALLTAALLAIAGYLFYQG